MNSLNSILVEGNLVRDPALSITPSGTEVVNFSIASNRFYKNGEEWVKETSFFDAEAWSKLAVSIGKLKKGQSVRVVGRLKQDRWTTAEGENRSRVKIVSEHLEVRRNVVKTEDVMEPVEA